MSANSAPATAAGRNAARSISANRRASGSRPRPATTDQIFGAVEPHDRQNRTELDDDLEDVAGIVEPEQARTDQQVRRRRDGQELRESLHNAQERRVEETHDKGKGQRAERNVWNELTPVIFPLTSTLPFASDLPALACALCPCLRPLPSGFDRTRPLRTRHGRPLAQQNGDRRGDEHRRVRAGRRCRRAS